MAGQQLAVMRSIGQLFCAGPVAGLDERELLERFAAARDEAAFAALVSLHGPMVLAVCRRMLHDEHDVEDAFQATFLVLVRRAGSIRDPGRLGPWLHGVARRVSMRARTEASRRRARRDSRGSAAIAGVPEMRPAAARAEENDVLEAIDEEVARLPVHYREAVILCDLEGRSYVDAARRLACPIGTLQSRLARGRTRLRTRLAHRGLAPALLAATLAEGARASVPDALAVAAVRAAALGAGAAPAAAAALAAHASTGLIVSAGRRIAGMLVLATAVLGAGIAVSERLDVGPPGPEPAASAPAAVPEPPQQPQPQSPTPRADRTLQLQVVDGDDRTPLAGASVWVRVTRAGSHTEQGVTDDEGRFSVRISSKTTYFLHVVVAQPGFVPIELRWDGSKVPDAYTLALPRGTEIGGIVRDEQGRPIAGARVFPRIVGRGPGGPAWYARMGEEIAGVLTDAQGRWRSEALPATAGGDDQVGLEISHPDFFAGKWTLMAAEARKRLSVQTLKAGGSISGIVISPTGRPIAGARVAIAPVNHSNSLVRLETDAQGRFRTGGLAAPDQPEVTLTVQADGLAAAMRRVTVTGQTPPLVINPDLRKSLTMTADASSVVIRMERRKPMRGRVIDAQGRPVPGAAVASSSNSNDGAFGWEATADAEGRFTWFDAPASGTVYLDAYKVPYRQARDRQFPPGSEDAMIVLHRPQHLYGNVTDASTGRPIERFRLVIGWGPNLPGGRPEWLHDTPKNRSFTGGRYDIPDGPFPDQGFRRSIRIEADGYLPGEFLGFLDSDEDVAHDFRLVRAEPLTGIVRGPDGRVVVGADVALSNADNDARIQNGRLVANRLVGEALHTKTDTEGRFRFQPQAKPVAIVAAHDAAGFAVKSPEEVARSTEITLKPWGRIEGLLKIGKKPAAGQKAAAWQVDQTFRGRVDYDATADGSGRFVFERVTPGRMTVYRWVDDADHHGWTASHPINVDVRPGETVKVQVGGTGRPVVGRLAPLEGVKLAAFFLMHGGHLATGRVWPPTPDDYPDFTEEQKAAWWDAFFKTPEGHAYQEEMEREYAVLVRPDGTFRIDDVPAGRYTLTLPFEERTAGGRGDRRALARVEVVVPKMPGGRSDQPLDLGAVPLDVFVHRELNVGDRVPAVTSKAADGRPLDLAALRGKFVLLAFWATYHDQTMVCLTQLKATHAAFVRDPSLVIIGLNEDVDPDTAWRYAARHGLAWEQRYLGSGDYPNPIASSFGVRYPAAVFLIGPDGRILAKDLKGDAIPQAVAKALAAAPQEPKPEGPGAAAPAKVDRSLVLDVVDAANQTPLAGTSVWVCAYRGRERITLGTTDGAGHLTIPAGERSSVLFTVVVAHPGFVPAELSWWDGQPVPERLTLALECGDEIGGVVRDEDGRPVTGARVQLVGRGAPVGGRSAYPRPESEIAAAVTDGQGRWRSQSLPHSAGARDRVELLITHSDRIPMTQAVTSGDLRILKPVSVLKPGRKVTGTVTSPTGRPVDGASVVVLFRNGGERYRWVRTDASGRFDTGRFIDPSWDELTTLVQAESFAASLRTLANTPEIPEQVIRLSPRRPLRGRVVDASGRPVAGAVVVPNWDTFKGKLGWEAVTDADGRFAWIEAPASGMIRLDVTRASFRKIQDRPVAAGSDDVVLTLHRPRRLHGTVVEADTGRPIPRFTVVAGEGPHRTGWRVEWKRDQARTFVDGRFDIRGDDSPDRGEPLSNRVEADGYEPAECLGLPGDAEDVARDVRLRKETPSGEEGRAGGGRAPTAVNIFGASKSP